jgi:hypothetical protein
VTLAALQRNYLFVRNRMEDVGVALQCYGMSIGHIAWGNSSTRTRGYVDVGKEYGAGVQPSWFCQWLENKVQDGAPYLGSKAQSAHMSPGGLIIGSLGPWPSPSACLNLCTVARRNDLEDDASFDVGTDTAFPYTQDLLLEGNTVRDSDVGFVVRQGVFGALLLGNMTTRCERDYDVREGASRDSVRIIR